MSNDDIRRGRTQRAVGAVAASSMAIGGLALMAPPAEAQQTVWGQACTVVLNLDIPGAGGQGGWTDGGPLIGTAWVSPGAASAGTGYHPPVPAWAPRGAAAATAGEVICVAGGLSASSPCDFIPASPGAVIIAGPNDDLIYGSVCADLIIGGSGNDTIFGLGGTDLIAGAKGADSLNGGNGVDALLGFDGNDTLNGGDGDDVLFGIKGDDILNGNNGDDCLDGGEGDDELYGWNGRDFVSGGDGNDYAAGNDGADQVLGGFGMDTLRGNDGVDEIWGDSASVLCAPTTNVSQLVEILTLDLADLTPLLDGIEFDFPVDPIIAGIFGGGPSPISDQVWNTGFVDWPVGASTGTYFNDDIRGGDSDDQLHGEAGDDTIFGDHGDDTIFGEGDTAFRGGPVLLPLPGFAPAENEADYAGAAGNDSLSGNDGDDSIEGGGGNDNLMGGADDDHLIGGRGTDRLNGGSEWDACEPERGFVSECEIVL